MVGPPHAEPAESLRRGDRPVDLLPVEGEDLRAPQADREGDDEDWRNVELPEGVTLR